MPSISRNGCLPGMRGWSVTGLLAFVLAGLPASPVMSAPAPDEVARPAAPTPWGKGVSEANKKQALSFYKRGNAHFEESRYAQALTEYLQAIRRWDHPAIRFNMAVCYINLKRPMEAYRNLRSALRFGAAPLGAHYKQARTYLQLIKGRLGQLTVECAEPGARVTLDGTVLFTGPGSATRLLLTGKHVVVAAKVRFITATRTIQLHSGAREHLRIRLLKVTRAVKMKRRWARWKPWTVLGAGALVALVGVPLILKANAVFDRYNDLFREQCSQGCTSANEPQELVDLHNEGRAWRAAAWTGFIAGGAIAATGVTLLIVNIPRPVRVDSTDRSPRRPRPRATVMPALGPGFYGVSATVNF